MVNDEQPPEAPDFDRAEFDEADPAPGVCRVCEKDLTDAYYEVHGQVVCPDCREKFTEHFESGFGPFRLVKSLALGSLGGGIGAALYYGVAALSGYEIGLIAIVVGWLVGTGVRIGSENRGGLPYQAMAVLITYLAIVTTYVPHVLDALRQADLNQPVSSAEAGSGEAAEGTSGQVPQLSLLGWLLVLAVAAAAPFLAGFQNIIGILIIGFALWEAGRQTRRLKLEFAGPFRIQDGPAS